MGFLTVLQQVTQGGMLLELHHTCHVIICYLEHREGFLLVTVSYANPIIA